MSSEVLVITVEGMRFPLDIVACPDERRLYVADSGNGPAEESVWRVSAANPSQYVKWLSIPTSGVQTLSVRSPNLLLTSPKSLRLYSTIDGELQRIIQLPDYVKYMYHAVETKRDTFVVGHRGVALSELNTGVSRLSDICVQYLVSFTVIVHGQ